MKRILALLFLLALVATIPEFSTTCRAAGTDEVRVADTAEVSLPKVVVFYLHGTARCSNCLKFEAWGKAAIDKTFAVEMKDGTLEWRIFDIDLPENNHFVEEFQLYTKSIVVARLEGGKVARWKNLDKIWELLRDEALFGEYVASETRFFLGEK